MKYRELGRTGWKVSEISFGAWAIGGTWGPVEDKESLAALHAALDGGVNFFDTADVYGDGHSERLLDVYKRQRCRAASDSLSSTLPHVPPMAHAPKLISETFQPVRPSSRYFMRAN